jgi:predicted TIM-barrel fold metal-dependent hydrolase
MIIDAHCHIWQGQLPHLENYISALKSNGVEKTVVLVLETWSRELSEGRVWRGADNDYIAECVRAYPDNLIMFGTVPPQFDNSAELLEEMIAAYPELKGVKLHPAVQGFNPTNPRVVHFVRKVAELGLPITIHVGDAGLVGRLGYNDPYLLDDLAAAVPDAKIIAAHGGMSQLVPWIVRRHPNMMMDTSYAPNWPTLPPFRWKFQCIDEDLVSFVGAEKILYGTDMNPEIHVHPTQVRDMDFPDLEDIAAICKAGLDIIHNLKISDREKRMILEENAKNLLNL